MLIYMSKKTTNLIILLAWPLVASLVSFLIGANMLTSTLLFLGIPCLYLVVTQKERVNIKKVLVFSLVIVAPVITVVDYIVHLNNQWFVNSMFSYKLFSLVPFEDYLWAFLIACFIILFYEYFFDHHNTYKIWGRRMTQLAILFGSLLAIFLVLYQWFHYLLYIPYFYFWFGCVLVVIPLLLEFVRRPSLIVKIFPTAAYFFFFSFIYELTALRLGQWVFPGTQYIGWVSILGVGFPFEELFFWFVLFATAVLCYYEFFDDDEK